MNKKTFHRSKLYDAEKKEFNNFLLLKKIPRLGALLKSRRPCLEYKKLFQQFQQLRFQQQENKKCTHAKPGRIE